MNQKGVRFIIVVAIVAMEATMVTGQNSIPDVLMNGTLSEQMNYVENKTRIYEDYRAIREDMFQKLKNNSIDSLTKAKNNIAGFVALTGTLNLRIDSLNTNLNVTKEQVKELTRTKNSISILGIELNKTSYNSLMWIIVAALATILGIGFLAFKRNFAVTLETKKELKDLRTEFEAYRQKTRLEKEKMSMDHFNEIRKLKGR
jgi:hypothetical protein